MFCRSFNSAIKHFLHLKCSLVPAKKLGSTSCLGEPPGLETAYEYKHTIIVPYASFFLRIVTGELAILSHMSVTCSMAMPHCVTWLPARAPTLFSLRGTIKDATESMKH